MILYSHPTGNAYVREAVRALAEAGLLAEFWTGIDWNPHSAWARLVPPGLARQLMRRTFPEGARGKVHTAPWREAGRLLASAGGLHALTRHETGPLSVDAVFRDLDRRVACRLKALPNLTGVYAGEDGARDTFRQAQQLGLTRFYELPIAYWETGRRLLDEEAARWPEWEPTLGGTRDSAAKLARKTEELVLADVVLTPSQFVLESLPANVRAQKACYVAEFGSPFIPAIQSEEGHSAAAGSAEAASRRPLRVLFAGSLTQRKGLADVFAAMKLLRRSDVELVVMGSLAAPLEFYRRQYSAFHYEAPRPHAEVLRLMQTCDVLVLPSLVEGRALVQQEALACGLPLIVTSNAGGEDLVDEGKTGYLVPIRSPEAIAEKIAWFADHRNRLLEMAQCARAKAAEYTWERYGHAVVDIIRRHRGT